MNKLKLKHLAPYFPYDLKVQRCNCFEVVRPSMFPRNWNDEHINFPKPYLRPLSDLSKEICHNGLGFIPLEYFSKDFTTDIDFIEDNKAIWQSMSGNGFSTYSYEIEVLNFDNYDEPLFIEHLLIDGKGDGKVMNYVNFNKLISWHFDVFGLIEKGLAIDINTLKLEDER